MMALFYLGAPVRKAGMHNTRALKLAHLAALAGFLSSGAICINHLISGDYWGQKQL